MLVVFGSLNLDLVTNVTRAPGPGETVTGTSFATHPGGKGANQAYAASRLGADVRLVGRVGADAAGEQLVAHLRAGGVRVDGVEALPGSTSGVALIVVEASGENRIVVVPGANGTWTADAVAAAAPHFAGAQVLLVQLETPLDAVAAAVALGQRIGAQVIVDPAPAPPGLEALPAGVLEGLAYLTPNEAELLALTGEAPRPHVSVDEARALARRLVTRGVRRVVAKLGAAGAILVGDEGEHWWPAPPVAAVDSTAAGDVFNGALAVALAEGAGIAAAGRFASAAAGLSVTRPGAQPGMPVRADVEALLAAWV
jgi:ribokinase